MALYNGHNEDASGNILLSIGNGMTATVESGTTASQAYTKGSYLYYNNRLCKVIAAIASGNTLTVGTNIAYTSLGAELTSHLRSSDGKEFYFDYQNGKYGYNTSASRAASTFVPFGDSGVNRPTSFSVQAWYGGAATYFYVDPVPYPVTFTLSVLDASNCERARFGYIFNPNDYDIGDFTWIIVGTSVTIPANTNCHLCLDAVNQNGMGSLVAYLSWS